MGWNRVEVGAVDFFMTRSTKQVWVGVSVVYFCVTMVAWAASYWRVPVVDEGSGTARVGPVLRVILPVPADAEEYVALTEGRVEQWEYAAWERQWYRYGPGLDLRAVGVFFAGLPVWWVVRGRSQK